MSLSVCSEVGERSLGTLWVDYTGYIPDYKSQVVRQVILNDTMDKIVIYVKFCGRYLSGLSCHVVIFYLMVLLIYRVQTL